MKIGLLWLMLLFPLIVHAQDVSLDVCRYPSGVYQFAYSGQIDGWAISGAESFDPDTLTATGDGAAFTVYADGGSYTVYGFPDVKRCSDSDEWQPGAPSILIPAACAVCMVEIWDGWHWSLVTDAAHPAGIVLYNRTGFVELIGSVGQDTDPAHYRLIEVNL